MALINIMYSLYRMYLLGMATSPFVTTYHLSRKRRDGIFPVKDQDNNYIFYPTAVMTGIIASPIWPVIWRDAYLYESPANN